MNKSNVTAKDYFDSALNEDNQKQLEIFMKMCHRFDISLTKATDGEQAFVNEITRVTYEKKKKKKYGTPLSDVRPFFG